MQYLTYIDETMPEIETITLYCDNCSGQNKNKHILAMFSVFLQKSVNIKTINLNYLMAGHTYMPADSVHSTIDSFIKNKIIYAPSQWPTVVSLSRHNPKPYTVKSLTYKDIMDWGRYEIESKCVPLYSTKKESLQEVLSPDGLNQVPCIEDVQKPQTKQKTESNRKGRES